MSEDNVIFCGERVALLMKELQRFLGFANFYGNVYSGDSV